MEVQKFSKICPKFDFGRYIHFRKSMLVMQQKWRNLLTSIKTHQCCSFTSQNSDKGTDHVTVLHFLQKHFIQTCVRPLDVVGELPQGLDLRLRRHNCTWETDRELLSAILKGLKRKHGQANAKDWPVKLRTSHQKWTQGLSQSEETSVNEITVLYCTFQLRRSPISLPCLFPYYFLFPLLVVTFGSVTLNNTDRHTAVLNGNSWIVFYFLLHYNHKSLSPWWVSRDDKHSDSTRMIRFVLMPTYSNI